MRTLAFLCAGAITMTSQLGCGGSGGDDDAADTGGSGSDSTGASTGSASASASATVTVSASASASASASEGSTDGSTSSADTGPATTDGGTLVDTGSGEGDTTAGADPCADLGRKECMADASCSLITCRLIEMSNNGGAQFCIGEMEFLGCQSAEIACAEVRTFTCMGDQPPVYLCPTACIPADWAVCESPVDGKIPECA